MRKWNRALIGAPLLLLAVALVVLVWDRSFRQATASYPGTSCPPVVQAGSRLPLASSSLRRVALIGDSIMNQASCSVADSLAQVGVQTGRYAVDDSGLLTGPVDWVKALPLILQKEHPSAVVAIFVGNYADPPLRNANGTLVADDSPEFYSLWQQRAAELSTEVHAAGATMYWVSPPPIVAPILRHAQRLFDGYRAIPGDKVLEAGQILAGPHGSEVLLQTTCGRKQLVRSLIDGIHLTDEGARLYGQQIAHLLSAQTGLLASPKPC